MQKDPGRQLSTLLKIASMQLCISGRQREQPDRKF